MWAIRERGCAFNVCVNINVCMQLPSLHLHLWHVNVCLHTASDTRTVSVSVWIAHVCARLAPLLLPPLLLLRRLDLCAAYVFVWLHVETAHVCHCVCGWFGCSALQGLCMYV